MKKFLAMHYELEVPDELARGIAIDLSIQFALFWMPFCVILGWWIEKPLTLPIGKYVLDNLQTSILMISADLFEISVLIATCL